MTTGYARNTDPIGTITTVTSVTTNLGKVVGSGLQGAPRGKYGPGGDAGDSGGTGDTPAKRCQTCKSHKPLSAFPRHNGSRDGRRRTCRECLLSGNYRPYVEPPEVRARRKARESQPKWQGSHRQALARYAQRKPLAIAASKAVRASLKTGRISKAAHCQVRGCTSAKHMEAQHWSYVREHWLDVLWCFAAHHRQGHAQGFIVPAAGIPAHYGSIPEMGVGDVREVA